MQENKLRVEEKDLGEKPKFIVKDLPTRTGPMYVIYFSTIEEAEKAVRDFWRERTNYQFEQKGLDPADPNLLRHTENGLASGMLRPTKHMITSGDRTAPRELLPSERNDEEFKNMKFVVVFNGNTEGLHEAGVEALRRVGFIK